MAPLTTTRGRRPTGLLVAGAGTLAVAALAFAFVLGNRGATPGLLPGGSDGPGSAMCVEQYSPAALTNRALAFDGTVIAIDGEAVPFAVNEAFQGVDGDTITPDAPGMTGTVITSAGCPPSSLASAISWLVTRPSPGHAGSPGPTTRPSRATGQPPSAADSVPRGRYPSLPARGSRVNAGRRATSVRNPRPSPRRAGSQRMAAGDTKTEAIRALRRRLSDEVFRRLTTDELDRNQASDNQASAALTAAAA